MTLPSLKDLLSRIIDYDSEVWDDFIHGKFYMTRPYDATSVEHAFVYEGKVWYGIQQNDGEFLSYHEVEPMKTFIISIQDGTDMGGVVKDLVRQLIRDKGMDWS